MRGEREDLTVFPLVHPVQQRDNSRGRGRIDLWLER